MAVNSGRDLAILRALSEVQVDEPIVLIGSHGAESSSAEVHAAAVPPDDEARLEELRRDITALIETHHPRRRPSRTRPRGSWCTCTASSVSRGCGHRRRAPDDARGTLAHPGVKVRGGKGVLELSVSHADKGSAGAARIYFGDDVTDEDAFIRITRPDVLEQLCATYRVTG